jgi:hypothetical protein
MIAPHFAIDIFTTALDPPAVLGRRPPGDAVLAVKR